MIDLKAFKEGIAKVLNIQTAHTQMNEAATEIETLSNEVTELKAKVADYEKVIGNFPGKQQEWEASLEKLKAEHTTAIDAIKAEHATAIENLNKAHAEKIDGATKAIEAEKNSVTQKVTHELKALGVPEGAIKETISGELTPQQIFEHFKTLKGAEATEYYRKHSGTILKAMATPNL